MNIKIRYLKTIAIEFIPMIQSCVFGYLVAPYFYAHHSIKGFSFDHNAHLGPFPCMQHLFFPVPTVPLCIPTSHLLALPFLTMMIGIIKRVSNMVLTWKTGITLKTNAKTLLVNAWCSSLS